MLGLAMVIAIGSSVLGTLISFQINAATGPSIVLIQATLFVLALLFAPRGGLLRCTPAGVRQATLCEPPSGFAWGRCGACGNATVSTG